MIYLDSAATTLQKPPEVAAAVSRAIQTMASPGRGGHHAAMLAAETVFRCREKAAELFEADSPEQVVFTLNATHALNLAIHSLVGTGDTVIISGYEHNAVTRPLAALGVNVVVAESRLFQPDEFLRHMDELLEGYSPSAVICTQMSNVFGYIMPIDEVAMLCVRHRVPLIVDASQSAGVLPVRTKSWGAAFVAMPGHKGLYGPQGTGILVCGGADPRPILYGGTGSMSVSQSMPDFLPDRLEAGTHNVAGIAGLLAGMNYISRKGIANIARHEGWLLSRMAGGLSQIPGVKVFTGNTQGGVLSFQVEGKDCEAVGEYLANRGIAVRAGLHCAPYAHRSAGTLTQGTVRASLSAFSTIRDVKQLVMAVKNMK